LFEIKTKLSAYEHPKLASTLLRIDIQHFMLWHAIAY
jgi:hypothetical protein